MLPNRTAGFEGLTRLVCVPAPKEMSGNVHKSLWFGPDAQAADLTRWVREHVRDSLTGLSQRNSPADGGGVSLGVARLDVQGAGDGLPHFGVTHLDVWNGTSIKLQSSFHKATTVRLLLSGKQIEVTGLSLAHEVANFPATFLCESVRSETKKT